jgi:hypothetical protein
MLDVKFRARWLAGEGLRVRAFVRREGSAKALRISSVE